MSIIEGQAAWLALHNFVRGLFGVGVFIVPVVLIYAAIMIACDKSGTAVAGKMIQGLVLIFLICGITHIFIFGKDEILPINELSKQLYDNGINLIGGGFASIVIGVPLLALFGNIGASIIVIILTFAFIMLLTNLNLVSLFKFLAKPFVKAKDAVKAANESDIADAERRSVERQRKEATKLPPNEPLPPEARKPKLENIDIPIPVEPKSKPVIENRKCGKVEEKPVVTENKTENAKNTSDIDSIVKKATTNNVVPEDVKSNAVSKEDMAIIDKEGQTKLFEGEDTTTVKKYNYPPVTLLDEPVAKASEEDAQNELKNKADTLVNTLKSFGVQTRIVDINRGPSVTRYELQPSAGVKISKITGLADDIALNLAATGVRIEAPIPGKAAVGIEVPNQIRDTVFFRELIESDEFKNSKSKLSIAVGKDIDGNVIVGDIAKMPHVIIAGTTGSGKSVCSHSLIMSILMNASPDEVKLILVDPKMVEFPKYNGIPHLLIPVVTDPRKAAGALNWAVQEMLKRYKIFSDNNARDLLSYNAMAEKNEDLEKLPQIVILIDELADLMMAASNEVEDAICRLAQMARAAGMHLVIATQRPTVDVVTGLIKANIPSRIALMVSSQVDSRAIIDAGGAEKLLGYGDMLYNPQEFSKPKRVQGCYVKDNEIEKVVEFIKNEAKAQYDDNIMEEIENNMPVIKGEKSEETSSVSASSGDDEIINRAIEVVIDAGQASTSLLQRKLKLGYARAARIIDELEGMGIISGFEGSKPRNVLISREQWYEKKLRSDVSSSDSE
ncbi:MAG: DNA translocase FtsK [Oscillospiraceae bacterium]|nr:DNA translocase FtsK [Oscillospiraceae bacterium]